MSHYYLPTSINPDQYLIDRQYYLKPKTRRKTQAVSETNQTTFHLSVYAKPPRRMVKTI
ncbi:hypothetical protein SERLA73DRAFT_130777 [Serpula lacrymans var. lacrymans S7.3]|uniref:Uncharacterized protein n=2 Tax=Serpula lacrymans var. lacrymans TaxID=341189 RepID=F8PJH4_SERL3|nr:uncharacterized protein SERLADRAFT_379727 [Serpula lacrymans var. lacrymans S7.9]EGO04112.1 hypothetical protein SERLA73DRAFT_130777 [Serpula lacrymans var. lacrymans S7.3]EGO30038.1 hypothetical protein SERLADRAFT_379727 [Serpula lacrymans var. lacrymans S7.9]